VLASYKAKSLLPITGLLTFGCTVFWFGIVQQHADTRIRLVQLAQTILIRESFANSGKPHVPQPRASGTSAATEIGQSVPTAALSTFVLAKSFQSPARPEADQITLRSESDVNASWDALLSALPAKRQTVQHPANTDAPSAPSPSSLDPGLPPSEFSPASPVPAASETAGPELGHATPVETPPNIEPARAQPDRRSVSHEQVTAEPVRRKMKAARLQRQAQAGRKRPAGKVDSAEVRRPSQAARRREERLQHRAQARLERKQRQPAQQAQTAPEERRTAAMRREVPPAPPLQLPLALTPSYSSRY